MKKILLAFLNADEKEVEKAKLIKELTESKNLETYSDGAVQTLDGKLYLFKVVAFNFPIGEFQGFDEVMAPGFVDILMESIEKLEKIVDTKKEEAEIKSEIAEEVEAVNDKDDDLDKFETEDDKAGKEDEPNEIHS